MKIPRRSRRPLARVAQRPGGDLAAFAPEPFVRVATLAPRDRVSLHAFTYEERVGALIRRAALPDGMSPDELDRVWDRLARRPRTGARPRGVAMWRWALAAVVLTLSGGTVAAGTGVWGWPRTFVRHLIDRPSRSPGAPVNGASAPIGHRPVAAPGRARDEISTPTIAVPRAASAADAPQTGAPESPPPSILPGLRRGAGSAPHARIDRRQLPAPAVPAVPRMSAGDVALSEEGQLLGQALAQLRQARDPTRALVELDRYAGRFPAGILAREARIARVDALLMAGRSEEARAVLSGLTLGSDARDRELRLIRAELTAERACGVALEDYQAVWAAHPAGPLGERALWGQAVCHARLGDEGRARADLAHYLARFPEGAHASAARARLGN